MFLPKIKQAVKRYTFLLLVLKLSLSVDAQSRDRRAKIHIAGGVDEISVSPDEKIWLTTSNAHLYFTAHIDSNWHYGPELENGEYSYSSATLDRISFFDKDTAIMTGYIASNPNQSINKDGFYRTTDGGQTWELRNMGYSMWVYCAQADQNGRAWLGSLDKMVNYTSDYGRTWTQINIDLKSSDRIYSIHMTDGNTGILGSDLNEILFTEDNWKNIKRIPTPLDQKRFTYEGSGYHDSRINHALIWKNHLVVEQDGHIYYSRRDHIEWKEFPVPISDFVLDPEDQSLFVVTNELKVMRFTQPDHHHYVVSESLDMYPKDMKIVNHKLFIFGHNAEVYQVGPQGLSHSNLYTYDKPIDAPEKIKQSGYLFWGITNDQIYLSEGNKRDWYRENDLNFSVKDFKLLDDSTALLWDGGRNHLYSLQTHSAQLYTIAKPFDDFLAYPIVSMQIKAGTAGCFHHNEEVVNYTAHSNSMITDMRTERNGMPGEGSSSKFGHIFEISELKSVLDSLNANPEFVSSINDFNISEKDRQNYLNTVEKLLSKTGHFDDLLIPDKSFYLGIVDRLDSIDTNVLKAALSQSEGIVSTTSQWFSVEIENKKGEKLKFYRNYYDAAHGWYFPWKAELGDQHFECYNMAFPKFIQSCIPDDFYGAEWFDNQYVIMDIANYLYELEKE